MSQRGLLFCSVSHSDRYLVVFSDKDLYPVAARRNLAAEIWQACSQRTFIHLHNCTGQIPLHFVRNDLLLLRCFPGYLLLCVFIRDCFFFFLRSVNLLPCFSDKLFHGHPGSGSCCCLPAISPLIDSRLVLSTVGIAAGHGTARPPATTRPLISSAIACACLPCSATVCVTISWYRSRTLSSATR